MELKLEGKIKLINQTQTWDSGFSKREFVITTIEQYPQDVKFEAVKDKATALDFFNVGDNVDVSFNVRGNEFNGKYYVSLQAWKISKVDSANNAQTTTSKVTTEESEEEIPF